MQIACLFLIACLIGTISCESCTQTGANSGCIHTLCDSTSHLECIGGTCTCVENGPAGTTCTTKAECDAVQNWNCEQRRRHCVDGRCVCSRF